MLPQVNLTVGVPVSPLDVRPDSLPSLPLALGKEDGEVVRWAVRPQRPRRPQSLLVPPRGPERFPVVSSTRRRTQFRADC